MSPSALKEFAKCPSRWLAGYESPDSDAKRYGSMLDCILLTPERFEKAYAVLPADAPRKPTKAQTSAKKPSPESIAAINWWTQFVVQHPGAEIIDSEEHAALTVAVHRLRSDEVIASYLDDSDKQVLVMAEWKDEPTGLTIPVRCLLDLVPRTGTEFEKTAGDVKTVTSAAINAFQCKVFDLSWHVQGAFDLDMLAAATGEDRNSWVWIVQENYAPWQTGKRLMSQAFLELGRSAYRKQLGLYCECLKRNRWFGYDDHDEAIQNWTLVYPSPWMESEGLFAPKFESEEAPETEQPEQIGITP